MTPVCNNSLVGSSPSTADRLVDAARACLLAVGWRRTTLTDVARRAGVSRMTVYRTYPDMDGLFADLMTREWIRILDEVTAADERDESDEINQAEEGGGSGTPRSWPDRIARRVRHALVALRANPLVVRLVDVDPELLLPYLLHRRGRSQAAVLDVIAAAVAEGQRAGQIRAGDPQLLARSIVLAAHGFFLSVQTMVEDQLPTEAFDNQLTELVGRYLAP